MSGEQISSSNQSKNNSEKEKTKINTRRIDINVLLNKVRSENKKEKLENAIFLGAIIVVVAVVGLVFSL